MCNCNDSPAAADGMVIPHSVNGKGNNHRKNEREISRADGTSLVDDGEMGVRPVSFLSLAGRDGGMKGVSEVSRSISLSIIVVLHSVFDGTETQCG
jgi:hypothetical protein